MAIQRLISPSAWKERQINALKSTGQANYTQGIQNPKADPIAEAIAAKGAWENGIREAQANDRFVKGLQKTSFQEWQGYAANIGAGKLVEGVIKREAKVAKFLNAWQPELTSVLASLDAMPIDTTSDRDAKMLANVKALRELRGKV